MIQPVTAIACHTILRTLLRLIPQRIRAHLYEKVERICWRISQDYHSDVHRLPFGLVLKSTRDTNEPLALQFAQNLHGVNTQKLVDFASTAKRTFLLMTWIDGETSADVWDELTQEDKNRIATELRLQVESMRRQTIHGSKFICNMRGASIHDPRIPWLREDPKVIQSTLEFYEQVWLGLNYPLLDTLCPLVRPATQRHVPVVFCHGDTLPKNIVLPGGLAKWRTGTTAIYLIDWEYAGWMPLPWEALKATWMVCDRDGDDWSEMMVDVFPESSVELEADWEWRSKSRTTIL